MFKASAIAIGVIMLAVAPVPAQDRAADKAAVEAAFKELVTAYATNDLMKVATMYNDPFLSIGQNKAIAAPEIEKWVQEVRATTMPKDYAAFKLKQYSSKPLGKDIILLSYVAERQTKDGQTIETAAATQLWKRTDKGWKFLTSVTHPPEDYIKLD
jgi:ketosteroid isomerase-like protein